jgi:hypothetical protein
MIDFTEKCRKAIEYIETLSPDMTERTGLTYFVKEHFSLQHRIFFPTTSPPINEQSERSSFSRNLGRFLPSQQRRVSNQMIIGN